MPEYNLQFAAKLAEVANMVDENDPRGYDAARVTLYLSRLSMEISMKALLERAGVPQNKIRRRWHDLRGLLKDLGRCEVNVEIAPGKHAWVPASRVRAQSIDLGLAQLPIGNLIDAEDKGASQYPNELRYGERVIDFKPSLVSAAAQLLAAWAKNHWDVIRFPTK